MRRIAHALAVTGLSAAGLALLAVPAAGHVSVVPATAAKGGYATLTFKVPNERPDASTTTLVVDFPEAYPFASISVRPKAGWDYSIEKANLPTPTTNRDGQPVTERVARITWTASGTDSQIKPNEFDEFPISAGPLPSNAEAIVFKALQTYSNGEVVRWIEEATAGSPEPRFPALRLALTDATPAAAGTSVTSPPASSDANTAVTEARAAAEEAKQAAAEINAGRTSTTAITDAPTKNQVNTAIGLAIGAMVLALISAGFAGSKRASRPAYDGTDPPAAPPTSPPPAI